MSLAQKRLRNSIATSRFVIVCSPLAIGNPPVCDYPGGSRVRPKGNGNPLRDVGVVVKRARTGRLSPLHPMIARAEGTGSANLGSPASS
jgi:hypothetical protein